MPPFPRHTRVEACFTLFVGLIEGARFTHRFIYINIRAKLIFHAKLSCFAVSA